MPGEDAWSSGVTGDPDLCTPWLGEAGGGVEHGELCDPVTPSWGLPVNSLQGSQCSRNFREGQQDQWRYSCGLPMGRE